MKVCGGGGLLPLSCFVRGHLRDLGSSNNSGRAERFDTMRHVPRRYVIKYVQGWTCVYPHNSVVVILSL